MAKSDVTETGEHRRRRVADTTDPDVPF